MMFLSVIDVADSDQPTNDPHPVPVLPSGADWSGGADHRGLHNGELYFQRCGWCRAAVYRRLLCPYCGSTDLKSERSSGTGVIRRTSAAQLSDSAPLRRALIEMDEGFYVRATVIGLPRLTSGTWASVSLVRDAEDSSRELVFRFTDSDRRAEEWT